MDEKVREGAIENLLNYCRSRGDLGVGRRLAPVLLGRECSNLDDEWALTQAMQDLLAEHLARARVASTINTPVKADAEAHKRALAGDLRARNAHLKIWSLMWAFYICAMSHGDIQNAGGWS